MIFSGLTLKDWFHKVIKTPTVCHQNLKNRIEQWTAIRFSFFFNDKFPQEMHPLQDFKQIGYFKVRNSPIQVLPDYLFMGLSIVHLTFFDCGELKLLTISWRVDLLTTCSWAYPLYINFNPCRRSFVLDSSCFQTESSLWFLLWWFPAPWEWSEFSFPVCTFSKLLPIDQRPIARFFSIS